MLVITADAMVGRVNYAHFMSQVFQPAKRNMPACAGIFFVFQEDLGIPVG
jgi:hypothetical protein